MARSKITERDGKIVFQGVEYTVDHWSTKKKAEADVEARQKELAEQRKKPVSIPSKIRLFVWLVIAIIAFPFAFANFFDLTSAGFCDVDSPSSPFFFFF